MNFRPIIRIFQTLLMLGAFFFAASGVQAGSSHHHHADSPFGKVKNEKPLHCILNMHDHFQNIPCSHQNKGGKSNFQEFRSNCGSHSGFPTSSNPLVAKDLFKNKTHEDLISLQVSSKIEHSSNYKKQNHPRSIDHPPQLTWTFWQAGVRPLSERRLYFTVCLSYRIDIYTLFLILLFRGYFHVQEQSCIVS